MLRRLQGESGLGFYGDDSPVEFTGRIYRYKGRTYALATLFRVYPPSNINSLQ